MAENILNTHHPYMYFGYFMRVKNDMTKVMAAMGLASHYLHTTSNYIYTIDAIYKNINNFRLAEYGCDCTMTSKGMYSGWSNYLNKLTKMLNVRWANGFGVGVDAIEFRNYDCNIHVESRATFNGRSCFDMYASVNIKRIRCDFQENGKCNVSMCCDTIRGDLNTVLDVLNGEISIMSLRLQRRKSEGCDYKDYVTSLLFAKNYQLDFTKASDKFLYEVCRKYHKGTSQDCTMSYFDFIKDDGIRSVKEHTYHTLDFINKIFIEKVKKG